MDNHVILANSASGGVSADTSKGFFFYTVLNRQLTIHDVQYTPFANGRSAYIGATVAISGVVTADTAHLMRSPLNTAGTNTWYMQNGNQPWNGIWFDDTSSTLLSLRNGDSVTVTGAVTERFDVTQIANFTATPVVHASNIPTPAPVDVTTGMFGPTVGNGTPAAEQWEGMLVRFNNVVVSDTAPVFSDPTEFAVDDGTGPILVRRDGRHNYSNVRADTLIGRTILNLNDTITYLQGIIFYSFNRYKIEPRANDDFGSILTGVELDRNPAVPETYVLEQNYPNPFNPSTTIEYSLPRSTGVLLKVYNVLGQEVRTLVNQVQPTGKYTVRFDASSLASGLYFYRLQAGEFSQVKKLMLLK